MTTPTRRTFLQSAAASAALAQPGAHDRVNIVLAGLHYRGTELLRGFVKVPNCRIAALCDVDERLLPTAAAEVEKLGGYRPKTEVDMRRLLDDKDIHAVVLATPDYWHAIQTIWSCQAGKDVYVEKPVSFTIQEGRRMVEAARKYNRIVQAGTNRRSEPGVRAAMRYLNEKKMGKVYRASVDFSRPRASIGRTKESSIPPGVHWDLYLGPSRYRPFTLNRFHYGWHYFWDTGPSEVGNIGVHSLDVCRWGLGKQVHPVKIYCTGGYYVWDSEQETPNLEIGSIKYADGTLIDFEVNNLYAPTPPRGHVFYTTEGYVADRGGWKAVRGKITPRDRPHASGVDRTVYNASFPEATYEAGPPIEPLPEPGQNHFENFIAAVRSRKREDLHCEILEGHLSTSLAQLSTISYRLGRQLVFNPEKETFVNDAEANKMLTRDYRAPYTLPKV